MKIGNDDFEIPQPYGDVSFGLTQRIFPIAGRMAAIFIDLLSLNPDIGMRQLVSGEVDVEKVMPLAIPGFGRIFSDMPPGELMSLASTLLRDATITTAAGKLRLFDEAGKSMAFATVMRGRTKDTFLLIWEAIKVWYPDFFSLGQSLIGGGQEAKTSSASTTSPPSAPATGSSPPAGAASPSSAA